MSSNPCQHHVKKEKGIYVAGPQWTDSSPSWVDSRPWIRFSSCWMLWGPLWGSMPTSPPVVYKLQLIFISTPFVCLYPSLKKKATGWIKKNEWTGYIRKGGGGFSKTLMDKETYNIVKKCVVVGLRVSAWDHCKRRGGCQGWPSPSISFLPKGSPTTSKESSPTRQLSRDERKLKNEKTVLDTRLGITKTRKAEGLPNSLTIPHVLSNPLSMLAHSSGLHTHSIPLTKKYIFFQFLLESGMSDTSLSDDFLAKKW